jgi:hypothetical protein
MNQTKHIIIAGDSVGCGEWQPGWSLQIQKLLHPGLAQYFEDAGYTVWNISRPDNSNVDTWRDLWSFARGTLWTPGYHIDDITPHVCAVFVFVTDWYRDVRCQNMQGSAEHQYLLPSYTQDLAGIHHGWFLHRLSELAQSQSWRIGLVGGWCDLPRFDDIERHHPGVYHACQSLFNLCVHADHRTHHPVTTNWWPADFLTLAYSTANDADRQDLLDQVGLTTQRHKERRVHEEFYAPDFMHPNRTAHHRLYQWLRDTHQL